MFLTNLFNFKKECTHEQISPTVDGGYCPDCGKYIKNNWYITRCACCGVKMKAYVKNGEIVPQYKYCSNCGSKEYVVEKLDKINFIDINFAALQKTEEDVPQTINMTTQCWAEKTIEQPKLPVKYL